SHEQNKRLCWCAQEEIYHLARELRLKLEKKSIPTNLLGLFEPPCYHGRCAEGKRYCGRDLKLRQTKGYFPERKI
ncbi:MAG: hypothetical protein NTZ80_04390, partial [Patescibacteria group bacterium]|nr:hypothetical protein [Patescibacteria group bacterium]